MNHSPIISPLPIKKPREPFTGSLELIIGPMFSGKTTELLRRIKRHSLAKRKCVVIKYKFDTRYSVENLSTHDCSMMPAVACKRLYDVQDTVKDADVIGIDEGQFYPDLLSFCEEQANLGKIVIISALDGTFERKRFHDVVDLIPMCESVEKLTAVCTICGGVASFSKRIVDDSSVELIGGTEKYTAVCRRCYFTSGIHASSASDLEVKQPQDVVVNPSSPVMQEAA